MDKLMEKKNLGIPVTLLVLIAYFIGYSLSRNLYELLVAVIFGGIVFMLDFDDKVKIAVKQSYTIGLMFSLLYMFVEVINQFSMMVSTNINYDQPFFFQTIFNNLYRYVNAFYSITVTIVFSVLVIAILLKKDLKLPFILKLLGEAAPKQSKQVPPMYQQAPQMYQQATSTNQQPPIMQQQVLPVVPTPITVTACPVCSAVNKTGATFCSSCGNKLQQ